MLKFVVAICVLVGLVVGGYFAFFHNTTPEKNELSKNEETQAPQNVAPDKVPSKVREAVLKRYPGAKIVGVAKLIEKGETFFDVSISHKGEEITVTLTPSGKIEEISREIEDDEVPEVVKKTLKDRYPQSDSKEREEVYSVDDDEEDLEHYRFKLVTAENKTLEVTVKPDGTFLTEQDSTAEATPAEPKDGKRIKKKGHN